MRQFRAARRRWASVLILGTIACGSITGVLGTEPDPPARPPVRWDSDLAHSSITFSTGHWGILDLVGWFEDFEVTIFSDGPDFNQALVEARVGMGSIRMPNAEMARNAASENFFDTSRYPDATFRSTKVERLDGSRYILFGEMTIKGITRSIRFEVRLNGFAGPPKLMPGLTAEGTIDRLAFGIGGSDLNPGNERPMVGEKVHLTMNLRMLRQRDPAPRSGGFTGKVLPVFYVTDVKRSVRFYESLGFEFRHYFDYDAGRRVTDWMSDKPPIWAAMAAGPLEFGLHRVAKGTKLVVGGTRHYFIVEDVASRHREVKERGIEAGPLVDKPWMTMFSVTDPDGHEIFIGTEK